MAATNGVFCHSQSNHGGLYARNGKTVRDPWARPFVGERPRTTKLFKFTTSNR